MSVMKNHFVLPLAVAALALLGCTWASPMAPSRLRLEYLREPLGVDVAQPRFSWALEHSDRGESQTAYRIVVSKVSGISLKEAKEKTEASVGLGLSALHALALHGAVTETVWDSGLVKSGQSTNVEYGRDAYALVGDTVYMWAVRNYNSIIK